jgi:hypothetical protein
MQDVRVYCGTKFENTKAVHEVYLALREDGHTITHDWTEENAEGLHGKFLEAYLEGCAEKDVDGVLSCDAFVLLNYAGMAGGFTEFGMALAAGKFIVVLDGKHPEKPKNIFYHLHSVHHAKDLEDARKMLLAHELFLQDEEEAPVAT